MLALQLANLFTDQSTQDDLYHKSFLQWNIAELNIGFHSCPQVPVIRMPAPTLCRVADQKDLKLCGYRNFLQVL